MSRVLVSQRIAECGCPEEQWVIGSLDVTIHFEVDGDGPFADCFADAGDWDVENRHSGAPDIAREAAFSFIESWR